MRDKKRIQELLNAFEKVWEQHPDLRFWQILFKFNHEYNKGKDMFYIEDDEFINFLKSQLKNLED